MYKNGVIIHDISQSEYTAKNITYNGIVRYRKNVIGSYLDVISLGIDEEIAELIINWYVDENDITHYYLDVIPTYDLLKRSVNHYLHFNIPIRILFIESEFDKPEWVGYIPKMKFIGYELGSSEITDPTMIYEIEHCVHPEFEKFANKLNENGLFNEYETISEYENIRNRLLSEGVDIENENPYYIMRISEINISDIV